MPPTAGIITRRSHQAAEPWGRQRPRQREKVHHGEEGVADPSGEAVPQADEGGHAGAGGAVG